MDAGPALAKPLIRKDVSFVTFVHICNTTNWSYDQLDVLIKLQ